MRTIFYFLTGCRRLTHISGNDIRHIFIRFLGHDSAPWRSTGTRIGGFFPTSPPELFKPSRTSEDFKKTNSLGIEVCRKNWKIERLLPSEHNSFEVPYKSRGVQSSQGGIHDRLHRRVMMSTTSPLVNRTCTFQYISCIRNIYRNKEKEAPLVVGTLWQ